MLKEQGVQKGDRVALYLPMVVELPVAMLACARIGAVHSVVFGGFSAESLAERIVDGLHPSRTKCISLSTRCFNCVFVGVTLCACAPGTPKVVVTADGVMRGAKPIFLKDIADNAHEIAKSKGYDCPVQVPCAAAAAYRAFAISPPFSL